jgi:hypothetical protein
MRVTWALPGAILRAEAKVFLYSLLLTLYYLPPYISAHCRSKL